MNSFYNDKKTIGNNEMKIAFLRGSDLSTIVTSTGASFLKYKDKIIVVVSHRKDNIDLFDTYIELQHGKIHTYLSKSKH